MLRASRRHRPGVLAIAAALAGVVAAAGCGATLTAIGVGAAAVFGGSSGGEPAPPTVQIVGSLDRRAMASAESIVVPFYAFDPTGGPLEIEASYGAGGTGDEFPATPLAGSDVHAVAPAGEGRVYSFCWDAQGDLARDLDPRGTPKTKEVTFALRARRGATSGTAALATIVAGHTPPRIAFAAGPGPKPSSRIVATPLRLADDTSDLVSVRLVVSAPGLAAREVPLRGRSQDLETTPAGIVTEVFWDSALPGAVGIRNVTVTVEAHAADRFGAEAVTTEAVRIENDAAPLVQIAAVGTATGTAPISGRVPITFVLNDPDALDDPDGPSGRPGVRIEVSADGGHTFFRPTGMLLRDGGADRGVPSLERLRARPFPAAEEGPGGNVHTFLWDALADGVTGLGGIAMILRVTPFEPGLEGPPETAAFRLGERTATFGPAEAIPIGADLRSVAIAAGDLNGDGKVDFAVANAWASSASIRLGAGDGSFAAPVPDVPVGDFPQAIALADLDGDGALDLLALDGDGGVLAVALGRGDGTFASGTAYAVGLDPIELATPDLAVADLDGDGVLDVVVLASDSSVGILAGIPGGALGAERFLDVGWAWPSALAVGDVDADGAPDIVIGDEIEGAVLVLRGLGGGDFAPPDVVPLPIGAVPAAIAAGDLDGDGFLDLAVGSDGEPKEVLVLYGLGGGSFGAILRLFPCGTNPNGLALGDLDGDGLLDVATANDFSNDVSVRLDRSGRSFGPEARFSARLEPFALALADVDGDGRLDLLVPNAGSRATTLRRGASGAGFGSEVRLEAGQRSVSLSLLDLDGDGRLDLVSADSAATGGLVLRRGVGGGDFAPPVTFPADWANSVRAGDLDGDGRPDLVSAGIDGGVAIRLALPDGGYGNPRLLPSNGAPHLVLADFNGDGKIDVAGMSTFSRSVEVWLGAGDGTFAALPVATLDATPWAVAAGDVDGDGRPDLLLAKPGIGRVEVWRLAGAGGFEPYGSYAISGRAMSVRLADLDGDGRPDLIAGSSGGSSLDDLLVVRRGLGAGYFGGEQRIPTGSGPAEVGLGDVNGDGRLDVIVAADTASELAIHLGRATRAVAAADGAPRGRGDGQDPNLDFTTARVPVAGTPIEVDVGDVNGDGIPDVAVAALDGIEVVISSAAVPSRPDADLAAKVAGGVEPRRAPAPPIDPALAGIEARSDVVRLAEASSAEAFLPEPATLTAAARIVLRLHAGLTAEELSGARFRVFREEPGLVGEAAGLPRVDRSGRRVYGRVVEVARREPDPLAPLPGGIVSASVDAAAGTIAFDIGRLGRYQAFYEAPTRTAVIHRETFDAAGPTSLGLAPLPPGWSGSAAWACGAPGAIAIALEDRPAPASAPNLLAVGLRRDYPAGAPDGSGATFTAAIRTRPFPVRKFPTGFEVTLRLLEWHDLGGDDAVDVSLVVTDLARTQEVRVYIDSFSGPGGAAPELASAELPLDAAIADALEQLGNPETGAEARLELELVSYPGGGGRGFFLDDLEVTWSR